MSRSRRCKKHGTTHFGYQIKKDSVGGIVRCVCLGIPVGLGEPCFDKLEADLAKAMLGIPATKDFLLAVVLIVFI